MLEHYLTIDIGNTLQKAAVFSNDGKMLSYEAIPHLEINVINSWIKKYDIKKSILSVVGKKRDDLVEFLERQTLFIPFNYQTKVPITIDYKSPKTLGLDRIACAVAAASLFPQENILSIQAGSCMVYDFINKENIYCGGAISPGIDMRFKALHQFTNNLPEIKKSAKPVFIGNSTTQSIQSGVINGVIYEIEGNISSYHSKYEHLKIILTGGDMSYLRPFINFPIFAVPNLALSGLYIILKLNV